MFVFVFLPAPETIRTILILHACSLPYRSTNSEKKLKKIEHVDDIFDTFTLFVPVVLVSDKMEGMDKEEVDGMDNLDLDTLWMDGLDHKVEVYLVDGSNRSFG